MGERGSRGAAWRGAAAGCLAAALGSPALARDLVARDPYGLLISINAQVNAQYRYGMPYDDPADGVFDCENYAQVKRDRLISAGWPRDRLRIWALADETGTAHAVLVVNVTPRQAWVLDNRTPRPLPLAYVRQYYTDWTPLWGVDDEPASQ